MYSTEFSRCYTQVSVSKIVVSFQWPQQTFARSFVIQITPTLKTHVSYFILSQSPKVGWVKRGIKNKNYRNRSGLKGWMVEILAMEKLAPMKSSGERRLGRTGPPVNRNRMASKKRTASYHPFLDLPLLQNNKIAVRPNHKQMSMNAKLKKGLFLTCSYEHGAWLWLLTWQS